MDDIARVKEVFEARWDDRIQDGIGHNYKTEPNLPWTSQAPSSSPGIGNYIVPQGFTAWSGDPSLLKTQHPATGSDKYTKGRHAKARDTIQGNSRPDPDPEYLIHGPPDPNRKNHWIWALYRE
ncbi:unnamed protein product [Phytophthora fragariaefolia]|uniref:Unnamed protein product n=1 Tax=Phytophthora fragariaefolia TaxID=1490495 RepID=A0A9W6XZI3_9STRA|nr:unnamed protein product [Phytophthora fragariaefolia]